MPFTVIENVTRRSLGLLDDEARRYALGGCTVFVTREPAGPNDEMLWHLSISHPRRHPTWDEIKAMRYWLAPIEITLAMLLPPPWEYVNVPEQDHVFHLWEVPTPF